MSSKTDVKAALLIIDVQEDFCPPNGSLAVSEGRSIVPTINSLLGLGFSLKVATKDHHPPGHISFASSHENKKPFVDYVTIVNPANPEETYDSRLWPDHCVVGTPGNELIPELDHAKIDEIVLKGCDPRVEMYSAFRSPLEHPPLDTAVSNLEGLLKENAITDVFVVGLAGDYCVKFSAIDSSKSGFKTYVVEEAQKCVAGDDGFEEAKVELKEHGVDVVGVDWVKEFFS